jgi:hypothetical protein
MRWSIAKNLVLCPRNTEALLDRKGIAALKKKLESLEVLLDDEEDEDPIEGDD